MKQRGKLVGKHANVDFDCTLRSDANFDIYYFVSISRPFWLRFWLQIVPEGIEITSEVGRREQRAFWEPSKATKRAHEATSRLLGGVLGFPGISRGGVIVDWGLGF